MMEKYPVDVMQNPDYQRASLSGLKIGSGAKIGVSPTAEEPGPMDRLEGAVSFLREAAGAVANLKDRLCGKSKEGHGDSRMIASGYLGNLAAEAASVDALARAILDDINEINSRL